MRSCFLRCVYFALAVSVIPACAKAPEPIPVNVVVVTTFEEGAITGDTPGEFQFWVERQRFDRVIPFPLGQYELRMNDQSVLVICTGMATANAATSIMALGLDSRFDLSKAYWLVAGIAGGDPLDVSLGTAAWMRHVVDGDLVYELDAREVPAAWPYGLLALGSKKPNDKNEKSWTVDPIEFSLNAALAEWAYQLTRDHPVADTPIIAAFRKQFEGYPNATRPPFVTMGDDLASSTYWHGSHLNEWANDWVKLQAGAQSNFMMTNMEDSGVMNALGRLSRKNLVDLQRVMILRTASNYSMPPPGEDTAWSLSAEYPEDGLPAKEAAYQVGSIVVQQLVKEWAKYRDSIPAPQN